MHCLLVNLSSVLFMHHWISCCFLDFYGPYLFRFHEVSMGQGWTKNTRLNNDGLMRYLCGATVYVLSTWLPMFLSIWGTMKTQHLSFLASSDIFEPFFLSIQMRTSCWLLSLDKDGLSFFFYTVRGPCKFDFFFNSPLLCVFMCLCLWHFSSPFNLTQQTS